jgi:bifunctional oligoribonuclease and PAP phosphatase NrnA
VAEPHGVHNAGEVSPADLAHAADLLRTAPDVTLFPHLNPDADALGSALALGMALRDLGATVRVAFASPADVPETLRHLDSDGLVVPPAEVPPVPELIVALDTGSLTRLGHLADRVPATIAAGGSVLVIDHHTSANRFGTHHLIDHRAESTSVLVLRLLDELGVELDKRLATCVYAGLMMDTSQFRRATPSTHHLAARLITAGVDPETVARQLVDSHPFAWFRMLSAVLARAQLEPDAAAGRGIVHTVIYLSDMDGVRLEEVESVVDILRTTMEAEVAIVLKELADGRWSGSLRSATTIDVSAAAAHLAGGGHRRASGFTTPGTPDTIMATLRAALQQPVII